MRRVLFVGNYNSIHDLKWVTKLIELGDIKAFAASEQALSQSKMKVLKDCGVVYVGQVNEFSLTRVFANIQTLFFYRNVIAQYKIDLIHVFIGTSHMIIPSLFSVRKVLTTRGTDVNTTLSFLSKSKIIRDKLLFFLLVRAIKRFDFVVSTSYSQIKVITKLCRTKAEPLLVRSGINIEQLMLLEEKRSFPEGAKVIFFSRNIHHNYDPLLSVEAISKLSAKTLDETHFVFMKGPFYDVELYQKVHRELNKLHVSYEFLDAMPNIDVLKIVRATDLVVMHPLTDGTPNSAIEAMLLNVPLIMGYCDYDDDLFNEETVMFLESRCAKKLADKIELALHGDLSSQKQCAFGTALKLANQNVEMMKVVKLYNDLWK